MLLPLSSVFRDLYNQEEAKEVLQRALRICKKLYCRDHIKVADILVSLFLSRVYSVLDALAKQWRC